MAIELLIDAHEYVLKRALRDQPSQRLSVLSGGAQALFLQAPLHEAQIERAIQIAEDWLMPYAVLLRDETLDVYDATGRLETTLAAYCDAPSTCWSVPAIEQVFLTMLAHVLRQAPNDPSAVADLILLRELAHHGQPAQVRLHSVPR